MHREERHPDPPAVWHALEGMGLRMGEGLLQSLQGAIGTDLQQCQHLGLLAIDRRRQVDSLCWTRSQAAASSADGRSRFSTFQPITLRLLISGSSNAVGRIRSADRGPTDPIALRVLGLGPEIGSWCERVVKAVGRGSDRHRPAWKPLPGRHLQAMPGGARACLAEPCHAMPRDGLRSDHTPVLRRPAVGG